MADKFLHLKSDVPGLDLVQKLFDARMNPEKRSPNDVTTQLVRVLTHPDPDRDDEAIPLDDVELPIRNPSPPTLPNGVTLPDEAQGGGPPNADFWHERLPLNKWGTVKTEQEMNDAGWFPESI